MAGSVFHIRDQDLAGTGGIPELFVHLFAKQFHEVDISPLVKTTDIIGLPVLAVMEDGVDGRGMVLYKEPITGI